MELISFGPTDNSHPGIPPALRIVAQANIMNTDSPHPHPNVGQEKKV